MDILKSLAVPSEIMNNDRPRKFDWRSDYWKNADFSNTNSLSKTIVSSSPDYLSKTTTSKLIDSLKQWDYIKTEHSVSSNYTSISVSIPELVKGKVDPLVLVNSVNLWKGKFHNQELNVQWENTIGEIASGTFLGLEMGGKIIAKVRYFSDPALDGYPIIKINGTMRRNITVGLITDMIIERIFVEKKNGEEITWWQEE